MKKVRKRHKSRKKKVEKDMQGDKGISAIVAIVLMILIVVAGVGIVWGVLLPFLNQDVQLSENAVSIDTDGGHTLYDEDSGIACVQAVRNAEEIDGAKILFVMGGSSHSVTINSSDLPEVGGKKRYCVNLTKYSDEPTSVSIVAIKNGVEGGTIVINMPKGDFAPGVFDEIVEGDRSGTNYILELDDEVEDPIDPEDETITYYFDGDGDGYGFAPENFVEGLEGENYTLISGDCDDSNFDINPGVNETFDNGIDDNCNYHVDCNDSGRSPDDYAYCGGMGCHPAGVPFNSLHGSCCDGLDREDSWKNELSIGGACYDLVIDDWDWISVLNTVCLDCGNGVCETSEGEDFCKCPADCPESDYSTNESFCNSEDVYSYCVGAFHSHVPEFLCLVCFEDCTNGVDDNGNGLVDCNDNYCSEAPACNEICTDKIDNNGNGLVDCNDNYCIDYGKFSFDFGEFTSWDTECQPSGETIFYDGLDNDGDGLEDCQEGPSEYCPEELCEEIVEIPKDFICSVDQDCVDEYSGTLTCDTCSIEIIQDDYYDSTYLVPEYSSDRYYWIEDFYWDCFENRCYCAGDY